MEMMIIKQGKAVCLLQPDKMRELENTLHRFIM